MILERLAQHFEVLLASGVLLLNKPPFQYIRNTPCRHSRLPAQITSDVKITIDVRFELLESTKSAVFWCVTPCSLV